jgi:beta-N-acetylhexosaminidase
MSAPMGHLASLAAAVLQPGFVGTTPPPWVYRWLGEGLGSVVLFARNVVDPTRSPPSPPPCAERPDVIVAIDERPVTSPDRVRPGQLRPATSPSARSTTRR